jgi:hypothetical protein
MTDTAQRDAMARLLDQLGADEARAAVSALGGRAAEAELERLIAERSVADMLAEGLPRPEIRDRLVGSGFSMRTAYRLIDAGRALFKPRAAPARSPTQASAAPAAPPATEAPTTTTPPKPEKEGTTMTPQEIKAECELIATMLIGINIPAAEKRAAEAAEAYAAERKRQADPDQRKGRSVDELQSTMARLNGESQAAQQHLQESKTRAAQLRARHVYLLRLGGGEEAVNAAQEKADAATAAFDAAEAKTSACRATLAQIVELIAAETAEVKRGRTDAGAAILDAVKAGKDPASVKVQTSDRLAALAVAKEGAEAELVAAQKAQDAARAARDAAQRAVYAAKAAVTELAVLQAEDQHVKAIKAHLGALSAARLGVYVPADLRHIVAAWHQEQAHAAQRQAEAQAAAIQERAGAKA